MEHHWFADRLSAWTDYALPAMEQAAMDEHVASCAECQRAAEEFRALARLVGTHSGVNENAAYFDDLARRTEARLSGSTAEEVHPGETRISYLRWGAAAAVLLLTSVVSWKLFQEQPPMRQLSAPVPAPPAMNEELLTDTSMHAIDQTPSILPETAKSIVPADSRRAAEKPNGIGGEAAAKKEREVQQQEQPEEMPENQQEQPQSDQPRDMVRKTDIARTASGTEFKAGGSPQTDRAIHQLRKNVSSVDSIGPVRSLARIPAAPRMAAPSRPSVSDSLTLVLTRLILEFRDVPDSARRQLIADSIRAICLQHPALPEGLIHQLDSLGFGR